MNNWPILRKRAPVTGSEPDAAGSRLAEHELVIGSTLCFRGDLEVNGDLRILGAIKGCVSAGSHTVVIEEDGVVEANVHAGAVVVRGHVRGAIVALGTVKLEATARVEGPIHASRLVLEEGCYLDGRMDVSATDAPGWPTPEVSPAPEREH